MALISAWPRLALLTFLCLLLFAAHSAEPPAAWPLWDGKETVEQYAKRAGSGLISGDINDEQIAKMINELGSDNYEVREKAEASLRQAGSWAKDALEQVANKTTDPEIKVRVVRLLKELLMPTKTLDLGNGVKLELVLIPAGKFVMGTPEPEPVDEEKFQSKQALEKAKLEYQAALAGYNNSWAKPAHQVTLTAPFYMGKYAVTQEQYQEVIGFNPSHFKGKNLPVESVHWGEPEKFCEKVSKRSGQIVRLPTEAEWEYSCRAGTITAFFTGDAESSIDKAAWHERNSNGTTHPVGEKMPNAWGLYDMNGNVWQFCQGLFQIYKTEPVVNPQGSSKGDCIVVRGGSWLDTPKWCGSFFRYHGVPDPSGIGFRVVVPVAKVP